MEFDAGFGQKQVAWSSDAILLAVSTGATAAFVANLYYAQALIPVIAGTFGLPTKMAGSVASAGQIGYGLGLFLVVPMADAFDNRKLVLACSAVVTMALLGIAFSANAAMFLACAVVLGIASSGAQVLIPYLSRHLPPETRGRALGYLAASVTTTVMLSRPLSLFAAATVGWRAIYGGAAPLAIVLAILLSRTMAGRGAAAGSGRKLGYGVVLGSMFGIFAGDRRVRRRALCQALIFATFTMFWAVLPILLKERFGLSLFAMSLFALVGAGGILSAPIAGRLADAGHGRRGLIVCCCVIAGCMLCSWGAVFTLSLVALAASAIGLGAAFQASQTFSRLIVLEVHADVRGRMNALYMTTIYAGGASGSIIGTLLYANSGWTGLALAGATLSAGAASLIMLDKDAPAGRSA